MPIELDEFWSATVPTLATATLLGSAWIAALRRRSRKTTDPSPPPAPTPDAFASPVTSEADLRAWERLREQDADDSAVAAEIDPLLTVIQRLLKPAACDPAPFGPSWFDFQLGLPDTRVGANAPLVECWGKHTSGCTIVHVRNCGGCAVRLLGVELIPPGGIADERELAFAGEFVGFRDGDGHPTGGAPVLLPRGEGVVRLASGNGSGVHALTARVITDAGSIDIPVGADRSEGE